MKHALWTGLCLCLAATGAQAADNRPVLAVFSIEFTRMVPKAGLDDVLSDYVSSWISEHLPYQVVPRDQIKQRLTQQKSASYKACYDQTCQIEVGKELAAEKTLAIKVGKVGNKCTVGLSLYDLRRATTDKAATAKAKSCAEEELLEALEEALQKLIPAGGYAPAPVSQPEPAPVVYQPPQPIQPPAQPAPVAEVEALMVDVPAGFAWRGCNKGIDPECPEDEQPGKLLALKAFAIDKTEVTVAQYRQCVQAGRCSLPDPAALQASSSYGFGYSFSGLGGGGASLGFNIQQSGRESFPMNGVSWRQAREYCAFAGKRLPTEAEWEKAARGTKGVLYAWGMDLPTCERAVMSDEENGEGCGQGSTAEVCSRPEGNSPYGLCDMAGNVWEWVEDMYAEDYYAKSPGEDPPGPRSGSSRSLRGGSYKYGIKEMRASHRSQYGEEQVADDIGFRCAKSLP
jgi:formylglycine-generating enzyme